MSLEVSDILTYMLNKNVRGNGPENPTLANSREITCTYAVKVNEHQTSHSTKLFVFFGSTAQEDTANTDSNFESEQKMENQQVKVMILMMQTVGEEKLMGSH